MVIYTVLLIDFAIYLASYVIENLRQYPGKDIRMLSASFFLCSLFHLSTYLSFVQ